MPNYSKLAAATTALFLCDAPNTAEGHRLRMRLRQDWSWATCSYNLERMNGPENSGDFDTYSGAGGIYEDKSFTPDTSSLYWPDMMTDTEMQTTYDSKVTGWARPGELTKDGPPSLWGSKGVLPAGVNQGSLGDCWFMSSAAAIAETPERIQKIFTNKDYSAEGIFQVTLWHMGKSFKEVVDDQIPITEGKKEGYTDFGVKSPVNANVSPNGAWWQVILEKAYAKYNLNYGNLNGGISAVALRELTGMPVETSDVSKEDAETFYAKIKQADKWNYVMTAGCTNEHAGLVTGHSYTMLGIVELSNGVQLIKLRNPWGKEQYSGPWNDKDPQWTDALKTEAGLTVADDGIFHIPLEDFKIAFTNYAILEYWDWNVAEQEVKGAGKSFKASLTSDVDQEVILTLDYENSRHVGPGCAMPNLNYNIYVNGGEPQAVGGGYGQIKVQATAGTPVGLEIINWGDAAYEGDFFLHTYAEKSKVPITLA